MKNKYILYIVLFALCFSGKAFASSNGPIDSLFRLHGLRGSYLFLDHEHSKYTIYNNARCKKRFSPASTFKIPLALIALESGIIKDSSFIFPYDSVPRRMDIWNRDLTFAEAMQLSCVPCFQQIAREVGVDKMKLWLRKFNYGNAPEDTLIPSTPDQFWLDGTLKISQFEQIEILKKIYFTTISAKKKSIDILKSIMTTEVFGNAIMKSKTGAVILDNKLYGWLVGYVEKEGKPYFFALQFERRLPCDETLMDERKALNRDILRYLKIIE